MNQQQIERQAEIGRTHAQGEDLRSENHRLDVQNRELFQAVSALAWAVEVILESAPVYSVRVHEGRNISEALRKGRALLRRIMKEDSAP